MNHTPNFNLNLPEGTDPVKVSDLNENFSIIDSNMGGGTQSNFIVTYTMNESTGEITADKTLSEIFEAIDAGKLVLGYNDDSYAYLMAWNNEPDYEHPYIVFSGFAGDISPEVPSVIGPTLYFLIQTETAIGINPYSLSYNQ